MNRRSRSHVFSLPDLWDGERVVAGRSYGVRRPEGRVNRYDVICFDPGAGAVSVIEGANRLIDAVDWMPSVPQGYIRLASVHVTENDAEVIETCSMRHVLSLRHQWVDRCQLRLQHVRRLVKAGQPIRLLGYGTSITAQGGPGNPVAPNGADRDSLAAYFSRLPVDTLARLDRFDHGTGAEHVHAGWNWTLKAALECAGSAVTYLNMGVAGTTTGVDESRDGHPNGGAPARLLAARRLQPDLVVIEYGMNELHTPDLIGNMVKIIRALRKPGTDVVVLGCPGGPSHVARWWRIERRLAYAARVSGAAFVPFSQIMAPENAGATGMARRTLCSANGRRHPGPAELALYGKWLAKVVPA